MSEKKNELKITRIYDAPLKAVWDAWTDPDQVAKWWGPRGFSITTHSKDLKTGGHWHYTMHGPDGTDYPNRTVYLEVDEYKRLVYDHGANDDQPALFRVTVIFTESKDNKTHMDMTMTFRTPEVAAHSKKAIKDADGSSTWDRLAEYLGKESTDKELFVINRSFNVDIDTLFDAWTDPDQLVAWSGPVGAQMEYINVDIRAGGKAFYRMPFGDTVIYGNVEYLEVRRPDRLVYIQQFANEDRSPGRHPLAPAWPQSMLTTVTFTKEGEGGTRVTLQWEVTGKWTEEEMDTFIKGRKSMSQGWGGSFDKLEEFLEN
ncbi:MAG: SRPBCC domain-containing protein [Bdellovibrionales bacterium]|nr:SRPBCC domain-containing protein [Bdellovibrionales bacterium]